MEETWSSIIIILCVIHACRYYAWASSSVNALPHFLAALAIDHPHPLRYGFVEQRDNFGVDNAMSIKFYVLPQKAYLPGMDISVPTANVLCEQMNFVGVNEVVAVASGAAKPTAILDFNACEGLEGRLRGCNPYLKTIMSTNQHSVVSCMSKGTLAIVFDLDCIHKWSLTPICSS